MLQENNKIFDGSLGVYEHIRRYILSLTQIQSLYILDHTQYLEPI
jgi:hypothetical protein